MTRGYFAHVRSNAVDFPTPDVPTTENPSTLAEISFAYEMILVAISSPATLVGLVIAVIPFRLLAYDEINAMDRWYSIREWNGIG